jgi:hypothetical protein
MFAFSGQLRAGRNTMTLRFTRFAVPDHDPRAVAVLITKLTWMSQRL